MYEKKNGDYYLETIDNGRMVKYKFTQSEKPNNVLAPFGTIYMYENGVGTITYPNGNKLVNVNKKEQLVNWNVFHGRASLRQFGYPPDFYIDSFYVTAEKPLKLIPAKQTEEYHPVFGIMVVGQEEPRSGFSKGDDRIYMITYEGEIISYLQKIPNYRDDNGREYYFWAGATDDIEKLTIDSTMTIHYKNGDLVQYRSSDKKDNGVIPRASIKLHRNGGTFLANNTGFNLNFADGSRFKFEATNRWSDIVKPEMKLTTGRLIKPDGTVEEYKDGVNLTKEANEKKAKEEAEKKRKYNALCQKYGKAHVDRLKRERVWIGMPEGLLKQNGYEYSVEQRSARGTKYYLYNFLNQPCMSVWVSQGKVTSITRF